MYTIVVLGKSVGACFLCYLLVFYSNCMKNKYFRIELIAYYYIWKIHNSQKKNVHMFLFLFFSCWLFHYLYIYYIKMYMFSVRNMMANEQ